MERDRAVEVIKQILEDCGYCKSITLMLDCSKGVQIKVDIEKSDEIFQSLIKRISKEKGLVVKKSNNSLILYKP